MGKPGHRIRSQRDTDSFARATGIHPTTIAQSFQKAAAKAVEYLTELSIPVDLNDTESLLRAASTSLNSKVRYIVTHTPVNFR